MADFFSPSTVDIYLRLPSASDTDAGQDDTIRISDGGSQYVGGRRSLTVQTLRDNPTIYYLGSCITCPRVSAQLVYRPIESERTSPGSINDVLCTEEHIVTMVLNRMNWKTYNRLRQVGKSGAGGNPFKRDVPTGKWIRGYYTSELYLRYTAVSSSGGIGDIGRSLDVNTRPAGTSLGRMYYAAALVGWTEELPNRVQEVGLQFHCKPTPRDGGLLLYSELDSDLTTLDTNKFE